MKDFPRLRHRVWPAVVDQAVGIGMAAVARTFLGACGGLHGFRRSTTRPVLPMPFRLVMPFLLMLPLATVSASAQVSDVVETGHAKTFLAAEREAAVPGETLYLGILQDLEDHWHVYWRNPGDSGLPLDLDWTLPDGVVVGDVQYPLPERIVVGPLVNFGHEGDPVFLVPVTVPETAEPGTTLDLSVEANWLICDNICVPETALLQIDLPIAAEGGAPTGRAAVRIADALRRQPRDAPFEASYFDSEKGPVLVIDGAPSGNKEFFPYAPSIIEPSYDAAKAISEGREYFAFAGGFAYDTAEPQRLAGVIVVDVEGTRRGYRIAAPRTTAPDGAPILAPGAPSIMAAGGQDGVTSVNGQVDPRGVTRGSPAPRRTLLLPSLGLAFVGGVLLNLMPCVFPVVFIKALGMVSAAQDEQRRLRHHGVVYTAGVLVSFAALAALLLTLRAGGESIGWGFHLQSPPAVGFFAVVLFLVGLNLAGVFEIGTSLQGVGDRLTRSGGLAGPFFTGVLAVAVATPCIGPFLGGAVGLALTQPALTGVLIFLSIGVGLAAPYLLLCLIPGLGRILPRPGGWMVRMRQLFSFALFASVVWLFWVLSQQAASRGVLALGMALLIAGFAAWLFGVSQSRESHGVRLGVLRIGAASALSASFFAVAGLQPAIADTSLSAGLRDVESAAWSPSALEAAREEGPVFVDFTAAWCVTCQLNKRTVLTTVRVREAFAANGVTYLVADWTLRDDAITAALQQFDRAGVPLYLYYPEGSSTPVVLPQLLTVEGVVATVMEKETRL